MHSNEHADLSERLVVVETKLDLSYKALEEVQESLRKLEKELTHYKGWIGGILFILSAIVAAFQLFKEWIFNK